MLESLLRILRIRMSATRYVLSSMLLHLSIPKACHLLCYSMIIMSLMIKTSLLRHVFKSPNEKRYHIHSLQGYDNCRSTFASGKRVGWHIDVQKPTFLFPENIMSTDGVLMVKCSYLKLLEFAFWIYFKMTPSRIAWSAFRSPWALKSFN